jgi:hypothetical protein
MTVIEGSQPTVAEWRCDEAAGVLLSYGRRVGYEMGALLSRIKGRRRWVHVAWQGGEGATG